MARADAFPEAVEYVDTGCEVSPSCLACPLPMCKYEIPGLLTRQRFEARRRRVAALFEEGRSVDDVAAELGVSRRTVFRDRRLVAAGAC